MLPIMTTYWVLYGPSHHAPLPLPTLPSHVFIFLGDILCIQMNSTTYMAKFMSQVSTYWCPFLVSVIM